MSSKSTPANDGSIEQRVRELEAELAEAKARIRKLESGGSTSVVVDQYDRPVVEMLEQHPDEWFGYAAIRSRYERAGVSDTQKIKSRLQSLVRDGLLERSSDGSNFVWRFAGGDGE
jgi:hypothetical protein